MPRPLGYLDAFSLMDTISPSFDPAGSRRGAPAPVEVPTSQYLTLRLGAQEYAVEILQVQEIRSYEEPTCMAQAPAFVKGVLNLRGVIVPIVDLRLKLGLGLAQYNAFTVVIVLNVGGVTTGVVVDAVSDVVSLPLQAIQPAPQFETTLDARFVTGLAKLDQRMLIILNLAHLMSPAEMGLAAPTR